MNKFRKTIELGFTIIELIIVLSIIGIIITIVYKKHTFVYNRAKDTALMMNLNILRNAVYRASLESNGNFPPTLDTLYPKYIDRKPDLLWVGANGKGIIRYNPEDGTIKLYDIDGSKPSNLLDSRGLPYSEY